MGLEVKGDHNPDGDIEIQYTGLRPGEKLYEELLIGDNPSSTSHSRIMKAREISLPWPEVEMILGKIDQFSYLFDCQSVRDVLMKAPLGYTPSSEINDSVWLQSQNSLAEEREGESALMAGEDVKAQRVVVPISEGTKKLA